VTGLPLVLVAPLDEEAGLSVVVGIPPYNDKSRYRYPPYQYFQAVQINVFGSDADPLWLDTHLDPGGLRYADPDPW